MSEAVFDLAVIGAGPGGYSCAIRAAQLGMKVALIDEWQSDKGGAAPGGTCANVGCIPSKALLHASHCYEAASKEWPALGVVAGNVKLDLAAMQAHKARVVQQNNDGLLFLFKKNRIEFLHGRARLAGRKDEAFALELRAHGKAEPSILSAKQIVLATGSVPRALPNLPFDETRVLSNTGSLALTAVPKRLVIIGAGVIGLELGSVWRRLGAQVTVLEALPQLLPMLDQQIAREAAKQFAKQGLKIELGVQLGESKIGKGGVTLAYKDSAGAAQSLQADHVVVAIGRVPNSADLGLETLGLATDERGMVPVDEECRTKVAGVWALGDLVRGAMLAHKAAEEGEAVAERMAGQKPILHYDRIPGVVYTEPEIAWVGQSEEALQKSGRAFRSGSFSFAANGRARAMGQAQGLIKILADKESDTVLGIHAVGPMVSEIIAEAAMAMACGASSEDIARVCHAHPTLSETLREAALAVDGRAIHA